MSITDGPLPMMQLASDALTRSAEQIEMALGALGGATEDHDLELMADTFHSLAVSVMEAHEHVDVLAAILARARRLMVAARAARQ